MIYIAPLHLFSQTISGKIENTDGEKIKIATIITKDSINSEKIKEFLIAKDGFYSLTLTKQYTQIILEISSDGYRREVFYIDNVKSKNFYTRNFVLKKDTVVRLPNVIVRANVRPFKIQGDTVSYNVGRYLDGSERKIQDVIKKLPGMEVDEKTGNIKYKGKSVETVKLDGDDLFSSDYAIGTKNINVDMVEEVQAIERYSENPLLKGIENSEKVALNLILKKKKTDFSGDVDLGNGVLGNQMATDCSSNLLGISNKYKSFATVSYNNVGKNNTPFDYFSYSPNTEQLKDPDLYAEKYISDLYFNSEIDAEKRNFNNLFFGSYNAVFKIGKKVRTKGNFYFLKDKIASEQLNISTNKIDGQEFTVSDAYSIIKKAKQLKGDAEVKVNVSKRSLLEYAAQVKYEKINTYNDILQNNIFSIHSNLNTDDEYFKQTAIYTTKISDKIAHQFSLKHTYNSAPQILLFSPAVFDPLLYQNNNQLSWFKKNNFILQSSLLGKTTKSNYKFILGSSLNNTYFSSDLNGKNAVGNPSISSNVNNLKYKQQKSFVQANNTFRISRFRITPSLQLSALYQKLVNNITKTTNETFNYLIESNLSTSYKINEFSILMISAGYHQKPFAENYFVENPVIISNRIIKSNDVELKIQKNKNIGLNYLIHNLGKHFQLNIGTSYSQNDGNYFENMQILQNTSKITYFFLPEKNSQFSFNFKIEKYVPFMESTIRFINNFSSQKYKNIVNRSSLRTNKIENFNSSLFIKTAFDGKVNFENTITHSYFQSKTLLGKLFNNTSIINNAQIIFKPLKQLLFVFSSEYFVPNTIKTKENFLFLNTDIIYQPKKKIYNFRCKVGNLTNNRILYQLEVTDFSMNYFQSNLLPRHFLLSVSRNF